MAASSPENEPAFSSSLGVDRATSRELRSISETWMNSGLNVLCWTTWTTLHENVECIFTSIADGYMCDMLSFPPHPGGGHFGIVRSIRLSVPWCSCLGYRHTGCLQLSHHQSPEMSGLWTHPPTDVDPLRFLGGTAIGGGGISSRCPHLVYAVPSMVLVCCSGCRCNSTAARECYAVCVLCIRSSGCHCHPKTRSSLASFKSRLVLPFWYRLPMLSWKRGCLMAILTIIQKVVTASSNSEQCLWCESVRERCCWWLLLVWVIAVAAGGVS